MTLSASKTARPEILIAVILSMTFGTVMLDRLTQMFLGPFLVADLHLSSGQIGLLASVVAIGWASSSLVFGRLSDRIGRKRVLIPAIVAFSLLSGLSGLAANFTQLLIVRALLGLAEGPCWSVIMALMEGSSRLQTRGRNLGIVNCAGSLMGSAIGPVVTIQLASAFGWRPAFYLSMIPGLILALVIALLIPEPPRSEPAPGHSRGELLALIRSPNLWLCFIGAMGFTVWMFNFTAFAPLYLTKMKGLRPDLIGWILGASGVGGFLYSIVWPSLSDRIGRKPALIMASGIAILLPSLFLAPFLKGDPMLLTLVAFLTSSGPAMASLLMIIMPVEIASRTGAATAIGLVAIGGEMIGATLGPLAGGVLAERFGLAAPLELACAAGVFVLLISFMIAETRPRPEKAP